MRERGAAGIIITLSEGEIKIIHQEASIVLESYPNVSEGTWSAMWDAIREVLSERMAMK